jgi:F0F1-type ATP synthase membrane subunit a
MSVFYHFCPNWTCCSFYRLLLVTCSQCLDIAIAWSVNIIGTSISMDLLSDVISLILLLIISFLCLQASSVFLGINQWQLTIVLTMGLVVLVSIYLSYSLISSRLLHSLLLVTSFSDCLVVIVFILLEFISLCFRVFSLVFRLFANVVAGHLILHLILLFLLEMLSCHRSYLHYSLSHCCYSCCL